jgi:hypothetical protein
MSSTKSISDPLTGLLTALDRPKAALFVFYNKQNFTSALGPAGFDFPPHLNASRTVHDAARCQLRLLFPCLSVSFPHANEIYATSSNLISIKSNLFKSANQSKITQSTKYDHNIGRAGHGRV